MMNNSQTPKSLTQDGGTRSNDQVISHIFSHFRNNAYKRPPSMINHNTTQKVSTHHHKKNLAVLHKTGYESQENKTTVVQSNTSKSESTKDSSSTVSRAKSATNSNN